MYAIIKKQVSKGSAIEFAKFPDNLSKSLITITNDLHSSLFANKKEVVGTCDDIIWTKKIRICKMSSLLHVKYFISTNSHMYRSFEKINFNNTDYTVNRVLLSLTIDELQPIMDAWIKEYNKNSVDIKFVDVIKNKEFQNTLNVIRVLG